MSPIEPSPSAPELKLSRSRIERMRAEVARRLAEKRSARRRMIVPEPAPRYDEVFARGVAWLNGEDPPDE